MMEIEELRRQAQAQEVQGFNVHQARALTLLREYWRLRLWRECRGEPTTRLDTQRRRKEPY